MKFIFRCDEIFFRIEKYLTVAYVKERFLLRKKKIFHAYCEQLYTLRCIPWRPINATLRWRIPNNERKENILK